MFGNLRSAPVQQFNIKESLAIKDIVEIDNIIEENMKLLRELENSDKEGQSNLTQESSEIDYSKLVEVCSDGFSGKYILNN